MSKRRDNIKRVKGLVFKVKEKIKKPKDNEEKKSKKKKKQKYDD